MSIVRFVETKLVTRKRISLPGNAGLDDLLVLAGYVDRATEAVWAITYNGTNVHTVSEVGRGDYHSVEIALPVMLRDVHLSGTDRFLLVHNHPTGVLTPSQADVDCSQRVMDAANTNGLYFEDFVIIGPPDGMFSFSERGLLIPAVPNQPMAAFQEPIVLR